MELYLAPSSETKAFYELAATAYLAKPFAERDAGLDAFCDGEATGVAGSTGRLMLGTRAAVYDKDRKMFRAFWLLPRSSISKSPLRMANSVGLIDAGYRGILMGAVDYKADFTSKHGERYFQIVGPNLLPWNAIHVVDEIPGGPTLRGEGGFGSTGKTEFQAGSAAVANATGGGPSYFF